jgi:neutral/alkaline ceramidase-like enzyme
LKAGFGKRSISPPIGAPLAGFAARQGVCEGIHDELFARALVLENDSAAVAMLSLDLLAVASDFVESTRRAIAARVPIKPSAVLIASTHTHAGPVTVNAFFNPDESLDAQYMAHLRDAIVGAIEAAWQSRFEARVGVGTGTISGLGVNRRSPDGKPIDREIGIVKVDDTQGNTKAVLINYGCHPTVLGPDNLLASGDFPAMTIERMETKLGSGSFAMYINGAQGDISVGHSSELSAIGVITPGRTFERATELGHQLADTVLEALPAIATYDDLALRSGTLEAQLPLKTYPSLERTADDLQQAQKRLDDMPVNGASPEYRQAKSDLLYSSITHFYARRTEKYKDGVFPIELQAIQIGDNAFIAVPAEVFAEVGLRLKQLDGPKTFVAGITNGYIGYLPSRNAYKTGGYEVVSSQCASDVEDHLVQGVQRLKETLRSVHG